MARLFDEVNDDIQITDGTDLDLPDSVWAVSIWIKLTDNVGALFQYFLSTGAFNAQPSLNWFIIETSNATNPDECRFQARDNDGTQAIMISSGTLGTSTEWIHLIAIRSTVPAEEQYIDGILDGSDVETNFDVMSSPTNLFIGARSDLNADRMFGGHLAHLIKWDGTFSTSQISALARGANPFIMQTSNKPSYYLPLTGVHSPEIDHSGNGNTGAITGAIQGTTNPPVEMLENFL